MGLSRELEALKRRANRAALATRIPEIEMLVYHEGDEIPEASSDLAIRVKIEKKRDYYGKGDPSLHPDDVAAIQGEDP
jgi:hypothetical protein